MTNLQELGIKNTHLTSFSQLVKVLKCCPEIKHLDFTYTESTMEDIRTGLKREDLSFDTLVSSFQKLITMKISTAVQGCSYSIATDPWLLMVQILGYKFLFNFFVSLSKLIKLYFLAFAVIAAL